MTQSLFFLVPPVTALFLLLFLGQKARKRRDKNDLGDMFFDAIKDPYYRQIIAVMIFLVVVTALYVVMF